MLALTLVNNCIQFSALAADPVIGKAFDVAVSDDAPVVSAYIGLGNLLRGMGPMAEWGKRNAAEIAAPLADKIKDFPPGAAAVVFGNPQSPAHSKLLWGHKLAPWLLLAVGLLWWRRPRQIHMGPKRLRR